MNQEIIKKRLATLDTLIVALRNIRMDDALLSSVNGNVSDAALLLSLLGEEKIERGELPVVEKPTEANLVEYLDKHIALLVEVTIELKNDAKDLIYHEEIISAIATMHAVVSLIKAKAFFVEFRYGMDKQLKEIAESQAFITGAKNAVILINEDMNHKYLQFALKSVWKDIWQKKVYVHNELKPVVSEYMVSDNLYFDSLHCDECIAKFDLKETLFITIGFKKEDTLPVALPKEAYIVMV